MFSIIVFFTTTSVVKQCMNVIMEAVPTDVDLDTLKRDLKTCPGVEQVHDLHVWELTAGKMVLTCHLVSRTPQKSLEAAIKTCNDSNIGHVTI